MDNTDAQVLENFAKILKELMSKRGVPEEDQYLEMSQEAFNRIFNDKGGNKPITIGKRLCKATGFTVDLDGFEYRMVWR